jgi:hypothetical protein
MNEKRYLCFYLIKKFLLTCTYCSSKEFREYRQEQLSYDLRSSPCFAGPSGPMGPGVPGWVKRVNNVVPSNLITPTPPKAQLFMSHDSTPSSPVFCGFTASFFLLRVASVLSLSCFHSLFFETSLGKDDRRQYSLESNCIILEDPTHILESVRYAFCDNGLMFSLCMKTQH